LSGTGAAGEKISQTSQNVILVKMLVIKNKKKGPAMDSGL